jgi:hypothetical protein
MVIGVQNFIRPHDYFIPSLFHPLFEDIVHRLYFENRNPSQIIPAESIVFVGYTILTIAIYAVNKDLKKSSFFLIAVLLFYLLSLGPSPFYSFFQNYFPFFSLIKAPCRFSVMVIFCLILLFSFGLRKISKKISKKPIIFFIGFLVLFEFFAAPYVTTKLEIPEFYENISEEKEDYAILDIPIREISTYLYYQTIHEKKMIGGYVSRTPYYARENLYKTPLFRKFMTNHNLEKNLTWSESELKDAYGAFKEFNIKFVIIHKNHMFNGEIQETQNFVSKISNVTKTYEDDKIISFKIDY